jgi:nucleoside-triphosphatase THEP1
MATKILITGISNSGKSTLLKTLKDVLVVSRDGKPFSLTLPHYNVPDEKDSKGRNVFKINTFSELLSEKIEAYKTKLGKYPNTIAIDSVSRIFTDIETSCSNRFEGFKIWENIQKEVNTLVSVVNELVDANFNVILIAHAVFDVDSGKYIETCKGSFAKTGGFLSTVDYALNIDFKGKERIVTRRGMNLSRTLLEDVPDTMKANDFNLQEYLEKVETKATVVAEKWSI